MRLLTDSPWAKQKTIRFTWTKPLSDPNQTVDTPRAEKRYLRISVATNCPLVARDELDRKGTVNHRDGYDW